MRSGRYVCDTNVIVSALLLPESTPGRAFQYLLANATLLVSSETLRELDDVLARPKFERYVHREEREHFVAALLDRAELVEVIHEVQACRDPSDDKFLALALSGSVTAIVTGDPDLLDLDPFDGVEIISPTQFVERLGGEAGTV